MKVASWVCAKTGTYEYRIMLRNLVKKAPHFNYKGEQPVCMAMDMHNICMGFQTCEMYAAVTRCDLTVNNVLIT